MIKLEPKDGEDYIKHWAYLDYTNKLILDIGADYGTTASWFLNEQGAQRVICIEGADGHYENLVKNTLDDNQTVARQYFLTNGSDFENLINEYKPDIVKVDIEGWERMLVDVNPEILRIPDAYILETHTADIYCDLQALFEENGFEVDHCIRLDKVEILGVYHSIDVLRAVKVAK